MMFAEDGRRLWTDSQKLVETGMRISARQSPRRDPVGLEVGFVCAAGGSQAARCLSDASQIEKSLPSDRSRRRA